MLEQAVIAALRRYGLLRAWRHLHYLAWALFAVIVFGGCCGVVSGRAAALLLSVALAAHVLSVNAHRLACRR